MEVFQSSGEEGVLTICLDDSETVQLKFKKKVQVSVKYALENDDTGDDPQPLKTEAPLPDGGSEKKSDPLDEELNGFIERVKKDGRGGSNLFPGPAEDLFGVGLSTNNLQITPVSGNNEGDVKEVETVRKEEKDDGDNADNDESAMDVECDSFDDHENDVDESADVMVKDEKSKISNDETDVQNPVVKDKSKVSLSEDRKGNEDKHKNLEKGPPANGHRVKTRSSLATASKEKSLGVHKDDKLARLVNELAARRNSIKRPASSTSASPTDRRQSGSKGKLSPATVFKCRLCEKTFSDSYLLSNHQRAENTKVMCKKCDLECMSKANLIIHDHLMHSKSGMIAGKKCPVCSKPFEKHSDILCHIRSQHTNEGLYKCCICRTLFQSYQTFKFHLDSHNKDLSLMRAKSNFQRKELNMKLAELSRVQQSSMEMMKRINKISAETTSSASRRKSHTPVQHRSVTHYQPSAKSLNSPAKSVSPSAKSAKISGTTVSAKLANSSPKFSNLPVKSGRTSPKFATPSPAKLTPKTSSMRLDSSLLSKATKNSVAKLDSSKPGAKVTTPKYGSPRGSKSSAYFIKKQVLASRLKPLLTPSLLLSRKRPLNQLPDGGVKTMPKMTTGRGPLKTLPRINLQPRVSISKRITMPPGGRESRRSDKLWKCHFCERIFRSKGEYINHKKPSRIIQTCKHCGFTSTSKALYLIHEYQKHTNRGNDRYSSLSKEICCHVCEESVKLNEVLNHIMHKHTGEHPYECCVCKKPAKNYEDWVSHGKSHVRSKEEKSNMSKNKLIMHLAVKTDDTHSGNKLFCNLCKLYYCDEKEFIRHHKSESQKKECEMCGVSCFTEAGYLIHKYISHGLSTADGNEVISLNLSENFRSWHEDDVAIDDNTDSTKCPSCLEAFPMKDLLSHVMNVHTQESPYKCCTCKATLSNLSQYIEHCDFHLGKKLYSRGTQRCLICGLRFESRIRLSRHKAMHKPSCPFCQMEFNSKALLDVHLKNFHEKDMTPCSFCGKLFAESNQLAEHERNHFFFKKSPCPICGLSVTNVNKHIARVHPKPDMNFLCNLCGQKFTLKCDLSRHMSRHSTDRRHECDICKKTFKRSAGLHRHAQSHLQNRKYHECHICGKKCSQRNNLNVHMRVHSATKAFTCEHCGQGFNYNQSLQTHIRKKHTEDSSQNAIATVTAPAPLPEPAVLNVRRYKPETAVTESMNQMVNSTTSQPNIVAATPVPFQEHPVATVYQPPDSSQHYYPDPTGYVPVNPTAFHRSYTDLINTIVRSEHDGNAQQNLPQQSYPVYYPQF